MNPRTYMTPETRPVFEDSDDVKLKLVSGSVTSNVTIQDLSAYFHLPINDAAKSMGVCTTSLKKICRRCGISRWPHRKIKSLNAAIEKLKSPDCPSEERDKILAQCDVLEQYRDEIMHNPNAALPVLMPFASDRKKLKSDELVGRACDEARKLQPIPGPKLHAEHTQSASDPRERRPADTHHLSPTHAPTPFPSRQAEPYRHPHAGSTAPRAPLPQSHAARGGYGPPTDWHRLEPSPHDMGPPAYPQAPGMHPPRLLAGQRSHEPGAPPRASHVHPLPAAAPHDRFSQPRGSGPGQAISPPGRPFSPGVPSPRGYHHPYPRSSGTLGANERDWDADPVRCPDRLPPHRAAAAAAMTPSQDMLGASFDCSNIASALIAPDTGSFLSVNDSFASLLDYSPQELMHTTEVLITHSGDRDQSRQIIEKMCAHVSCMTCQYGKRVIRRNGTVVWVLVHKSLARDAANRPWFILVHYQDLGALRQRFCVSDVDMALRLLFGRLRAPMLLVQSSGSIFLATEALLRWLMLDRSSVVGSYLEEYLPDIPENRSIRRKMFADGPDVVETGVALRSGKGRLLHTIARLDRSFYREYGLISIHFNIDGVGPDSDGRCPAEACLSDPSPSADPDPNAQAVSSSFDQRLGARSFGASDSTASATSSDCGCEPEDGGDPCELSSASAKADRGQVPCPVKWGAHEVKNGTGAGTEQGAKAGRRTPDSRPSPRQQHDAHHKMARASPAELENGRQRGRPGCDEAADPRKKRRVQASEAGPADAAAGQATPCQTKCAGLGARVASRLGLDSDGERDSKHTVTDEESVASLDDPSL
eukprot:Rmarinus@m.12275